jgi:hypothetical protein
MLRVVDDVDATGPAVGMQNRPDTHGMPGLAWLANAVPRGSLVVGHRVPVSTVRRMDTAATTVRACASMVRGRMVGVPVWASGEWDGAEGAAGSCTLRPTKLGLNWTP